MVKYFHQEKNITALLNTEHGAELKKELEKFANPESSELLDSRLIHQILTAKTPKMKPSEGFKDDDVSEVTVERPMESGKLQKVWDMMELIQETKNQAAEIKDNFKANKKKSEKCFLKVINASEEFKQTKIEYVKVKNAQAKSDSPFEDGFLAAQFEKNLQAMSA
mmetsp:Transcript_21751/g.33578  ORF Transcript_21751/g.33578 Transcript_21751/m.33578 type:complete len:165 (+) Transcript_21751:678-1172(+)|eukprot:CAMPEP_0170501854 /NCGR_PEP_ID=MMETSP0208-20121228/39641_1 /TAXON_ID=197538 /ORGANISM="Strombidium inclinatum, Strain S3" /LENGTH=164 /DNA_ID=CAMNT_0010780601 /DNA_START=684 /DNA_END=1178 /DNA_ORIENTATION=-